MQTIIADFARHTGNIKPMHAVNNGPVYRDTDDQSNFNLTEYREAGFPFARTHDASFFSTYGGEHTVDIRAVFPNFDADANDPASYDFACTDEYLRVISLTKTKVFYRLGSRIEHEVKKYGTLPPKDFRKWAVICEHIIRHYTEGWANGFYYDIPYWEIWNEPDLDETRDNKKTWGGTREQFFELYDITAKHLKACFPRLKIGGPALAGNLEWAEAFLAQLDAPLDFFSWHIYATEPAKVLKKAEAVHGLLNKYGRGNAESILNEWNYVSSFKGEGMVESIIAEKGLKGSSFNTAVMAECQKSSVDMLMYYDARPCGMNGLFDTDIHSKTLKGYYSLKAFNTLYELGGGVKTEAEAPLYAVAAASCDTAALLFTSYCDTQPAPCTVELQLRNFSAGGNVRLCEYLLDETHDLTPVTEKTVTGGVITETVDVNPYSTVLITLKR